jgi:hypothetical protein
MAEDLTPAQKEMLRQQRLQRFKSMGLPEGSGQIIDVPVENVPAQRVYDAPAPVINEAQQQQYNMGQQTATIEVPNDANIAEQIRNQIAEERAQRQAMMYTAPRDKFAALEAIRKGAKRQEFKSFIKAEGNGVNGNQLPEPKVGKRKSTRPGQPQEKSVHAVEPKAFISAKNQEAEQLEGYFTDRAQGISMKSSGAPQGNLVEHDSDYSNVGPSFDPVAHLRKKAEEKGINVDLTKKQQTTPQVFQAENSEQMSQLMLMMETMMKNQQKGGQYNLEALKTTMETIAKKVAEDTIKRVLKEYVESQKKKNIFEVANKEKNIIKIGEKYFQLTPVKIALKS